MTSLASLGYPGNTIAFRVNPDAVDWNFNIEKAVINTLGGRVVQILGTTLSDIVVKGQIGEDHSRSGSDGSAGRSWAMAEAFVKRVHTLEEYQRSAPIPTSKPYSRATTTPPLRFVFPEFGWDFSCYIKDISDPTGGGAITHSAGKFAYQYALTLFVEAENSSSLAVLKGKAADAAEAYITRISKGIGWDRDRVLPYSAGPGDPGLTGATATGSASTGSQTDNGSTSSTTTSSSTTAPTSTPSPTPTTTPTPSTSTSSASPNTPTPTPSPGASPKP